MRQIIRKVPFGHHPIRLIIIIIISLIVIGAALFVYHSLNSQKTLKSSVEDKKNLSVQDIEALWGAKEYKSIIDEGGKLLRDSPSFFEVILYRGYSEYYYGVNQEKVEDRTIFLLKSIVDLRKAIQIEPYRNNTDIYYILGKAYFNLGYYYQDLALKYLVAASASPLVPSDVYEYLGVVNSQIGNNNQAIHYFEKAINSKDSEEIHLAMAVVYASIDKYDIAIKEIQKIINNSKDSLLVEKARFRYAEVLNKEGKPDDALNEYLAILRDNPNSADAHFYVGEKYAAKGDLIKARAEWRNAYNIDPKHSGAINRLNSTQ